MTTEQSASMNVDESGALRASLDRFAMDSARFHDIGADVAAVARDAYVQAKREGQSEDQIAAAMTKATDDLEAARAMASHAVPQITAEIRRGIWWDIAVGIGPALGLVALLAAGAVLLDSVVSLRVVEGFGIAFALVVLVVLKLASGTLDRSPKFLSLANLFGGMNSPLLTSSAGALVVGLVVFGLAGSQLSNFTESRQTRDLALLANELSKVDDAVAITVAALKAQTTPERAQALVKQETGVGWTVEQWKPRGGAVIARADLRDGQAVVRFANAFAGDASVLDSFLLKNGKEREYRRYLVGKVIGVGDAPLDARKVTLKLDSSPQTPMVFTLPAGKFAPAIGTQFVAVEKRPGELSYFQELDGVVQKFSIATRSDRSAAVGSTDMAAARKDDVAKPVDASTMEAAKK